MEILKCTHKRIKDRLGAYYEKIWKDMLVKTNESLVYRKPKTEFKMELYLTQVTNKGQFIRSTFLLIKLSN